MKFVKLIKSGLLNENSLGEPISNDLQVLQNFWNWFNGSKVVDKQGRPLVVYHGTRVEFDTFDTKKSHGIIFFSTNDKQAKVYGKRVIATYLKILNPFIVPSKNFELGGDTFDKYSFDSVAWRAKQLGYDGVINKNVIDNPLPFSSGFLADNYTVFYPNQIKSISNNTNYSKEDNSIYGGKL